MKTGNLNSFNTPQLCCGEIYSLGFWDSDESVIERACFDVSKTVRFFAAIAKTKRSKRSALTKIVRAFGKSQNSRRGALYFALAEQADRSHIETLYRNLKFDEPASLYLNDLESTVKKRVEAEQKNQTKEEQDALCQSARFFNYSSM